ncbi:MAG TPA: hypothetical protein VIL37_06710 [Natronosporangium sp.]
MIHRSLATAVATTIGLLLAGCDDSAGDDEPPPIERGQLQEQTLAGGDRTFLRYVPESYDPATPAPLVLVMHGQPGSAYAIAGTSGMHEVAEQEGFLVAYPDDLYDIGLLRDVIEQMSSDLAVAPDRIYATGFSIGGRLSWQLAMSDSVNIAAIASMLGPLAGSADRVSSPVSAMQVIGLADVRWLRPIEAGLAEWREARGCAEAEPEWVDDQQQVSRSVSACDRGGELVEYRVEGLPHRWPASLEPGVPTAQTIWEFFAAHPAPAASG